MLIARSRVGARNFGPARDRRDIRKGRNCEDVPRGPAINVDRGGITSDEGPRLRTKWYRRKTESEEGREKEREGEGVGPLIAEILEVNWREACAGRTLARRNAFQLS